VLDPPEPAAATRWPFTITFEAVRARYPGEELPAVDRLNLRLDPGEHVALVGASGAGKSTIAQLMVRFLDPESGRITLAGRDLRDYGQSDLRRLIVLAGQDSHLFSASIRDNVRLGRPDASDSDLERALRQAQAWEWVQRLPDGLDTSVGEIGRELSGGQRQRLVVARALLADAPVVILDEPTAHLDPGTARELAHDVLASLRDRTVLLITHRSEGLELVDRVVPLEVIDR
jgi:ABC-type multidrug transport system fused ATPase/permease subunit